MEKIYISYFPRIIIILGLLILLSFFHLKGIIPYDEGWVLHPAVRFLQGDVPYKDFHFIYTPGSIFIAAFFLKILGESILAARIGAILISFTTVIVCYKIGKLTTNSTLLAILPPLMFILWGPTHITFLWPTMLAVTGGIITVFFLLTALKKKSKKYFFLAGILTSVTVILKQNLGLALIFNVICFFLFIKEARQQYNFLWYFSGLLLIFLIFLTYLLNSHSFFPFLQDFYFFMIEQTILKGMQSTPFLPADIIPKVIIKLYFYLIPLVISLIALIVAVKKKSRFFILATFPIFYYLLGIRPTTDYVHLTPLLSLIGFPFALLMAKVKSTGKRSIIAVNFILVLVLAVYSILFKGFYRWQDPILKHSYFLENPRSRVFTDSKSYYIITKITEFIQNHTLTKDPIFVYTYSPLFYFLTDRKNPTKFEYLPPNLLSENDQKEIIQNLEDNKVHLIVTDAPIIYQNTLIANFIKNNFNPSYQIDISTIWTR
ncbi:MAG: hypothetical protein A2857_01275 [Candidatus Levybacteria bacterium RIFCSPHIGHO2_01_FULL_36_15]|nr:MAG: hypothetical protein A2857_01275 [Candidatus Levybacteria bacterium RIFCSPHIGHO2_01_FULL_36_15]OGH37768.1 MAG: hypothetical protein A2905_02905 [Candidatus Levybacteria bacterium RIFCSPLOWO2_01_FULL_36_10]